MQSTINSRIIDESARNCHRLICRLHALLLLACWLHKTLCNCTIIACSSTNTVGLYASIWLQTIRFNMPREYSSLATTSARQCSTCYGRDGTIASRSIDTERWSPVLVLARKQKAIVRPSVSFQRGGLGFQVWILLTFAVTAAVTLFVQPLA